jgi:hypothetical protein
MVKLFKGKYDLNVMIMRMVIDTDKCDGSRLPLETKEIVHEALRAGCCVGVERDGLIADIFAPMTMPMGQTPDFILSEDKDWDFVSVRPESEKAIQFLNGYLNRQVELEEECRSCCVLLRGKDVIRNQSLCLECETKNPNYFTETKIPSWTALDVALNPNVVLGLKTP